MGKKRSGKKGDGDDYDDAGSLCSTSTAACSMQGEDTYVDAQAEALSSAIDDTYESRASTREKAWERIVALLRNNVRLDDCYQSASTLSSRCLSAIRKGGAAEVASAATALALHLVTLGEPNESLFQEVLPELKRATKYGKGPAVKVAAADALALCCFVAAEDESTTGEVMDHLQSLWRKDVAKLRVSALRGWSFLYTSLNSQPSSRQLETLMATFAELLHDSEVEVRAAAGEGLALLYHSSGLADGNYEGFEGFDDEEEEDDEELDELIEEQQAEAAAAAVAAASLESPLASPTQQQQQQQQQQQGDAVLSPAGTITTPDSNSNNSSSSNPLAPLTPASVAAVGAAAAAAAAGSSDGGAAAGGAAAAVSAGKPPLPSTPQLRQQQQQRVLDSSGGGGGGGDNMSLASCSSVSGLDLVVDRMKDLASNRGDRQRRSKRERSVLKGTFRELRSVMEDGRVPEQKIKLRHGDSLLIDSMEGNTMINWLKRFLAGGFQVHLQGNPFLHSVFGFTPLDARPERLTAQEKRAFRSPCSAASKARSQARRSDRAFKDHGGGGGW